MTAAGWGPRVLMPSVITSTCLWGRGDLNTVRPAAFSALPRGVEPPGVEKSRAQFSRAAASNGPNLTASRAPLPLKIHRPASTLRGAPDGVLVAKVWICLVIAISARLAMTYFGEGPPELSGTGSRMEPEVS